MRYRLAMCAGLAFATIAAFAWGDDRLRRGEYILRAAGCASCHTDSENNGAFLAGGRAIDTPFGTFFAPNITPDPKYGIGGWSDTEFVRALRLGLSPAGAHYYPAFPYTAYTRMRQEDMLALKAYLFSVPAVARENTPHQLPWYARFRSLIGVWKLLYFDAGEYRAKRERSPTWNRGSYLATAMAHCGECHTPRNMLGALLNDLYYAGTRDGPGGELVPNITPDRGSGIGRWSQAELAYFLKTGADPQGDYAGSLMAEVIDDGLRYLNDADLDAIATYALALPPVSNPLARDKKSKRKPDEFD